MRVFGLFAVWVVGLMAWPTATPVVAESFTSFERGHDDIVLAVRLNGRGPFRLLLDTGSTHTTVSVTTAAAIGAPVVAKAAMGSAAGSLDRLVVRVDALEVGGIAVSGLLASVVEFDRVVDAGRIDGVIGQDALASLRYTIDFVRRRVVWSPRETMVARGNSLELQASDGRFLLLLPQQRTLLRLVPDTGAESLLLFDPDRTLPVTHLPTPATLATTSGEIEVRLARMRELYVGTLTLRDVPAAVAQRDRSEPAEVDGLLPLRLFDRITIDGPGKRLIVEKIAANRDLMFF
jgi:predicted aspartyl protease